MVDTLVAAVVGVDKPGHKIGRQRSHGEAMILRGDVAAFSTMQNAGLVLAAMPKFQFVGIAASRQGQQLVPQADAEDRDAPLHRGPDGLYSPLRHLRVAGAIRNHYAIEREIYRW